MGKRRIIAETGAGQHGVATATAAALLGLECCVYMGRVDMARQRLNVVRMRMLGAEVRPVDSGIGTLKDALNEAIRDWVTNVRDTHYVIGSAAGPAPYPEIVAELQSVIGDEAREQMLAEEGRLPGGGRGLRGRRLERHRDLPRLPRRRRGGAGGRGGRRRGHRDAAATARRWGTATPACCTAATRTCSRTPEGQVTEPHSISAGLDYPGVGPEHSFLRDSGPGALRERHRRRGARGVPGVLARRRGSSRRSRARTRWRWWRGRRPPSGPRRAGAGVPVGAGRQGRGRGGRGPGPRWLRAPDAGSGRPSREAGRPLFMPYVMGGYPDLAAERGPRRRAWRATPT